MSKQSPAPRPASSASSGNSSRAATPLLIGGIAVAVVAAASGGVALGLRSSNTSDTSAATGTPSVAATSEAPTSVASPIETPSPSAQATSDGEAVPVYYVKDDPGGPRLYREFRPSTSSGSTAARALVAMIGKPSDPDYRTLWRGARLSSYSRKGNVATASFTSLPALPDKDQAIALQQIVYTVTAAEQNPTLTVSVLVDGKPLAPPTSRADRSEAEGAVWLLTPIQNATTGRTVALSGIASVFEATVSWDVRTGSADGQVVASGSAQARQAGPARAPWKASVTLEPGTYVVRAYAADESGAGDEPVAEDTKVITVR